MEHPSPKEQLAYRLQNQLSSAELQQWASLLSNASVISDGAFDGIAVAGRRRLASAAAPALSTARARAGTARLAVRAASPLRGRRRHPPPRALVHHADVAGQSRRPSSCPPVTREKKLSSLTAANSSSSSSATRGGPPGAAAGGKGGAGDATFGSRRGYALKQSSGQAARGSGTRPGWIQCRWSDCNSPRRGGTRNPPQVQSPAADGAGWLPPLVFLQLRASPSTRPFWTPWDSLQGTPHLPLVSGAEAVCLAARDAAMAADELAAAWKAHLVYESVEELM